jgi:hypothetical protein
VLPMKLKGIKPIEQHVEKIVIGVTGAVGLGLLGYQFFAPATFQIGKETVTVAETFKPAAQAAQTSKGRMESPDPAVPTSVPAALDGAAAAIGIATNAGFKRSDIALVPAPQFGAGADRIVAAATFAKPTVEAPQGVTSVAFRSTVHPIEKLRYPELAKFLPAEQPFDKAAVSIESVFNGQALRDSLLNDPDGETGPMQPIPLGWWRDGASDANSSVQIVSVEVERETLRLPDGSTPKEPLITTLGTLPGRFDAMKAWGAGVKSLGDVASVIEQVRQTEEDIQRPRYLATIAGAEWKPPSEMIAAMGTEGEGKSRRINDLRRKLSDLDNRIADIRERLQAAGGGSGAGERGGDREVRRPAGGGGGGGKGGGGGGRPSERTTDARPQGNPQVLQRQLDVRIKERDQVVASLSELGESVERDGASDTAAAAGASEAAVALTTLENDQVKLYSHDITVEAGAQYRYRVRVIVNNPLFGRNLQESQKVLAEQSLVPGAWSAWSAPVEVDPSEFFFVTSAQARSDISPTPQAAAEMYVFYYGYYRVASTSLQPGDSLGGAAKLPELKMADMKKLEELVASGAPLGSTLGNNPGSDMPGRPGDPAPARRGRFPGSEPEGERPSDREARERGRGGSPAGGGEAPRGEQGPQSEWLNIDAKKTIDLRVDAVFLDATPVAVGERGLAGESRELYQAVLRNRFGQLLSRSPDSERGSELYKRLEASAKLGERQGAPEGNIDQPTRVIPKPADPVAPKKGGGGSGG